MDTQEFFQLCAGKWFSQHTSHYVPARPAQSGKSDLTIEAISSDDPQAIALCQQLRIDPQLATLAVRITWDGSMGSLLKSVKQAGSTVLVVMADPEQPDRGQLLRQVGGAAKKPAIAKYQIGNDDAFTLITENDEMQAEERIWFASPNLRLRTQMWKGANGSQIATFYSEIRKVELPPKE
jgi:hypothetical protein